MGETIVEGDAQRLRLLLLLLIDYAARNSLKYGDVFVKADTEPQHFVVVISWRRAIGASDADSRAEELDRPGSDLSIAEAIAAAHHGEILFSAESSQANVRVRLPSAPSTALTSGSLIH
jgi:hypothetical protein